MKKVYSYLANYIVGWNKSESLVLNWSATAEVYDSFNDYVLLLLNVIWNLSNWNHFLLQFSKSKEIYARQYKQWWFWLLFIYFFSEYWITIQLLSGRYSDLVLPQWHRLSDIHVIWNISWFLFQQWLGKMLSSVYYFLIMRSKEDRGHFVKKNNPVNIICDYIT